MQYLISYIFQGIGKLYLKTISLAERKIEREEDVKYLYDLADKMVEKEMSELNLSETCPLAQQITIWRKPFDHFMSIVERP